MVVRVRHLIGRLYLRTPPAVADVSPAWVAMRPSVFPYEPLPTADRRPPTAPELDEHSDELRRWLTTTAEARRGV